MKTFEQFLENIQNASDEFQKDIARRRRIERIKRIKAKLEAGGIKDTEGDFDAETKETP